MHTETLTEQYIAEDILNNRETTNFRKSYLWMRYIINPVITVVSILLAFLLHKWWILFFPFATWTVYLTVTMIMDWDGKQRWVRHVPYYMIAKDTLITTEHNVLRFGAGAYKAQTDNYRWSKDLRLSIQGMLNTSVAGDTFYLIINPKSQKILCVYNRKYFICPDEILSAHSTDSPKAL